MRRALACLATIAVADVVLHRVKLPWLAIGIFDHPAHLATAELVALNMRRSDAWKQGLLVGALLPDIDHIPLALRSEHPEDGDPRPNTHTPFAVLPVAAAAAITGSERLRGVAAGMLTHYARDLAVGGGLPMMGGSLRTPYPPYAVACAVLALTPAYSRSRP
ncbi:MAG TPA: metal-dependent hydrolase [Solirubrobacterales bacterium]|nr:metal-dependent hydrolase [Solirubrobacterales bacterium]